MIDGVKTATAGSNLIQSAHEGKQGPPINEITKGKRGTWGNKIEEPDDGALGCITSEGFDPRQAEGFLVSGAHTHTETDTLQKIAIMREMMAYDKLTDWMTRNPNSTGEKSSIDYWDPMFTKAGKLDKTKPTTSQLE